jgi:S1-C subfamily serine protease
MEPGSNRNAVRTEEVVAKVARALTWVGLALGISYGFATWAAQEPRAGADDLPGADLVGIDGFPTYTPLVPIKVGSASLAQVRSGTAFFVSRDGKALTSAHVVKNCQQITIWIENEEPRDGKIIGVDPKLDIALLASSGTVDDIADVNTTIAASAGEVVTTIGFGIRQHEPRQPEVTSGTVFGQEVLSSGSHVLVVKAALKQGNSGGPVVDNAGSVVGLVIGRYTARPDLSVAVPSFSLGMVSDLHLTIERPQMPILIAITINRMVSRDGSCEFPPWFSASLSA